MYSLHKLWRMNNFKVELKIEDSHGTWFSRAQKVVEIKRREKMFEKS